MERGKSEDSGHIVKTYDEELKRLSSMILRMGGLAESQIDAAMRAVARRDGELAEKVIQGDRRIDDLDHEVDHLCTRLLALRQPMAVDLRAIVAAIKLSSDLERVGDYAKNIGKRTLALIQSPTVPAAHSVPRLGAIVQRMIKDVLDAYSNRDVELTVAVWRRDEEVDALYNSLFRELLTYMMEDPRNITSATHLLFIAKNIERIGDHITNMAENIYFVIEGAQLTARRPKGDRTPSFTGLDLAGEAPPPGEANGGPEEPR